MAPCDRRKRAMLLLLKKKLLLLQMLLLKRANSKSPRRRRRWWVRPVWLKRKQEGEFHTAMQLMKTGDPEFFRKYYRMHPKSFEHLHNLVRNRISKKYVGRSPLSSEHRLAITLRYLSSGDEIPEIALAFRVGITTARMAILECCRAIWDVLQPLYMKSPTAEDWSKIAEAYNARWQFPNCIGAVDGKHVVIQAPKNSGSQYYNHKGTFSIVLMAVVDSFYRFTIIDVGAYGRQSDGGILKASEFGRALSNNLLRTPSSKPLPGTSLPVPHVFVGDEAFQLRPDFMRPYPGRTLTHDRRIFNYRLSRARRCVENAFGILSARWRIFRRPINLYPENVDTVVKATCILHNFLRTFESGGDSIYCPSGFADSEGTDGEFIPGTWREELRNSSGSAFCELPRTLARNFEKNASNIRDHFASYFVSPHGSVSWQESSIGLRP